MKPQRITMITLAVMDLEKSREFYSKLGWTEASGGNEKIAFYEISGQFFALYSSNALVQDIGMTIHNRTTGAITLATNYGSEVEVDAAYETAKKAGAIEITRPAKTFWGGYSAYYTDPDGHLWEVAYNPFWNLGENGQVIKEE